MAKTPIPRRDRGNVASDEKLDKPKIENASPGAYRSIDVTRMADGSPGDLLAESLRNIDAQAITIDGLKRELATAHRAIARLRYALGVVRSGYSDVTQRIDAALDESAVFAGKSMRP